MLMLNDQKWLQSYFASLANKLRTAYEVCVGVLKDMSIPYIPAYVSPDEEERNKS
jgi:hypothetical protein